MARRRNDFLDRLAALPVHALVGLARALPYRARLGIGAAVGRAAVRLPRFRRRIEANLRHVLPDLSPEARARVARETGDGFGRTLIEILTNDAFHAHGAFSGPTGAGAAAIEEAVAAGRGAVLVTGHFGQWEAVRAIFAPRGVSCAGVYRPIDNPRINAIYVAGLTAGGPVFPKGRSGVRGLVGHLVRGGMVGILTDQYDRRGAPLDFLGHPAPTMLTAAELALKYRLPLVPAYGVRAPDGEHVEVVTDAPVPHTTPEEMMQAVNDSLAAMVRRHPGQYYWLHRRWRKDLA